jgi:hypothetical protein
MQFVKGLIAFSYRSRFISLPIHGFSTRSHLKFYGSRRPDHPETLVRCFAMSTLRRFSVFLVNGCAFCGL